MVAYEMAQQLREQGQEVALLVMFDNGPNNVSSTSPQSRFSHLFSIGKGFLSNLPHWFVNFIKLSRAEMQARVERELRVVIKAVWAKVRPFSNNQPKVTASDLIDYAAELPEYRQRLIEIHHGALQNYLPKPYEGEVTLLKARSRSLLDFEDPEMGWKQLVGNKLNVETVPGSHEGIFKEPAVEVLANLLADYLKRTS
jgi:thioesterase domain-containing protein